MEASGISDGILTELLREKSVRLGVYLLFTRSNSLMTWSVRSMASLL